MHGYPRNEFDMEFKELENIVFKFKDHYED